MSGTNAARVAGEKSRGVNGGPALNGGFDWGRNIRLYRDFVSPVTEFDAADRADATTLTLDLRRLTTISLDLSTRSTRYTKADLEGWSHSLSISASLTSRSLLETYGGIRDETVLGALVPEENHTWYGLDWDLFVGRHWMFSATVEKNQGQGEGNDQVYATMGYRF